MHLVCADAAGMSSLNTAPSTTCHCQAIRQAARRVSALYDAAMAPLGLRVSQYGILVRLQAGGPRGIQALAAELVMDRTTLGRNIRPLERDDLLSAIPDPADRRGRLLAITPAGADLVARAAPAWWAAQAAYEAQVGKESAAGLHAALADVVAALHSSA